jgi:hypothetical protein
MTADQLHNLIKLTDRFHLTSPHLTRAQAEDLAARAMGLKVKEPRGMTPRQASDFVARIWPRPDGHGYVPAPSLAALSGEEACAPGRSWCTAEASGSVARR